jgi:ferric-dicitrate binding protein FerR (iron transport regulator)
MWLNSGSSISYNNKFGETDRTVVLKGEAFFDVTKNKDIKFIVKTGTVNVVVHGTAFNVKSYLSDQEISVSLLRGSVDVVSSSDNKSLALLSPGERFVVEKLNLNSKVQKCDASLDGIWRLEKLKFEGATITEVAEKLGKWYGIDIAVKDTNKFQKYWFTVKSESINDILKSMNGLHPIKYSISGDNVVISSR